MKTSIGLVSLALALTLGACGGGGGSKPDAMTMAYAGVTVGSTAVRSCEVLLADHGRTVNDVVFDEHVKGTQQRRFPRTGLAFTALTDAPLAGSVAKIESAGTPTSGVPAYDIVTARCYDREGKPVDKPGVQIQ
jgi:hypothetical protein